VKEGLSSFLRLHIELYEQKPRKFNPYRYLLDHGQEYTEVRNPPKMSKPNLCHNNSFSSLENSGWKFVTGYGMIGGVPLEHSWNLDEKGMAVDCTAKVFDQYYGIVLPYDALVLVLGHKLFGPFPPLSVMANMSDKEQLKLMKILGVEP
jgi:hypothetical protein